MFAAFLALNNLIIPGLLLIIEDQKKTKGSHLLVTLVSMNEIIMSEHYEN
jgi:hypothetical protein